MEEIQFGHEFVFPAPEPIRKKKKKYCPECWKLGHRTELKGSRQFLCKEHYKNFRKEREAARQRFERKLRQNTTTAAPLHIVRKGTTDIGPHLRKKDGKHDFEKEQKIIQNEKRRIFNKRTAGDIAYRIAGGKEGAHLPEILERDKPVYNENLDGYIQYGEDESGGDDEGGGPSIVDEWSIDAQDGFNEDAMLTEDVDEFFKKPEKEKPKSLKEKYSDWEYYKDG